MEKHSGAEPLNPESLKFREFSQAFDGEKRGKNQEEQGGEFLLLSARPSERGPCAGLGFSVPGAASF